jgi:hypothetical protein
MSTVKLAAASLVLAVPLLLSMPLLASAQSNYEVCRAQANRYSASERGPRISECMQARAGKSNKKKK